MNTLANKLPKSLNLDSAALSRLNQILPRFINLILIIACSYTLSQLTWSLVPDEKQSSAPASFKSNNQAKKATNNYRAIADAHLFGNFQQSTQVVAKTDAPETRLNLVLKGVLATNPMEYGSAIIALGKNGKEDTYAPGDKISSATVKEIYADRVILERSGKLETLRMPKDKSAALIRTAAPVSKQVMASGPGAVLSNIRKQIIKNPTSFGKFAIPIPVKENGVVKGYRLQPQGDRSLFDAVGLNPSDVIVAVNGIGLNNPANGLKALRALQRAKSVKLTVLRNGAEIPLQFDLP